MIADQEFNAKLAERRREAVNMSRTTSTPMWLVAEPACPMQRDMDAATLGRAWSKLDAISADAGLTPLSNYLASTARGRKTGRQRRKYRSPWMD